MASDQSLNARTRIHVGRSVRLAPILGLLMLTAACLVTQCVGVGGEQPSGALTVVHSDDDGEDGYVTDEDNDDENEHEMDGDIEDFQPSEEWKDVKKGQKIPPGLHVQMNFETGKKQAKLMEGLGSTKKWDAGKKIGIINTQQKTRFSRDELKKALKDLKYKDADPKQEKKQEEEVLKKFRSYEELQTELQELKLRPRSEGEIVVELLGRVSSKDCTHEDTVAILTDLEYYLHQIDNAQIFSERGGISQLVILMNSTKDVYRSMAAHALGSALQSNAKVQIAALESGVLPQLLKMISTDISLPVRKKALYAVSTLVRGFPYAQRQFLLSGGLSALADLFMSALDEALRIKIVTFLTDLLQEHDFNVGQSADSNDSAQMERRLQYKDMSLRDNMQTSGWCGLMISLVQSSRDGHDSVDKMVTAMTVLASTCRSDFSPARPLLQSLLADYDELARSEREEGEDGFFTGIHTSLQQLINQLGKDEL